MVVLRGNSVGAWRISLLNPDHTAFTLVSNWEANSLGIPRNENNMSAKLLARPGGRWAIMVNDLSAENGRDQPSSYEQDGPDWRFLKTYGVLDLAVGRGLDIADVGQITLFSRSGWWLKIYSGGEGIIGFGADESACRLGHLNLGI